jgi:8-oxo-dGTP pyrophosphatase MutT (NUDIX family)
MYLQHSFCSFCGQPFDRDLPWPRTCERCSQISYLNPLPVGVLLLPVGDGVLCVRRAIEPGIGELALPGGFLDVAETWQQGCARELFEETGIRIDPDEVRSYRVHSASSGEGLLLVFGLARPRQPDELPEFVANSEVSERVVLTGPQELVFPLHTQVVREFFAEFHGKS